MDTAFIYRVADVRKGKMATPVVVHARREHEQIRLAARMAVMEGGGIRLGIEQGLSYKDGILYRILARSKALGQDQLRTEDGGD